MSKTQSTPGYHETTLEGLKADWVALAQRCTQIEVSVAGATKVNRSCTTTAVILAVLAVLLAIANTVYLVVEAWS